jgi:hypothetical protein
MDSVTRIVCETVKAELEKQVQPLVAAADALKAENTALKKKLEEKDAAIAKAVTEARAFSSAQQVGDIGQRIVDIVERTVNPNLSSNLAGFGANVIGCLTSERALTGKAYYNPGTPLTKTYYVVPMDPARPLVKNACLQVVYDPATPVGCIEVGVLQRLAFGLAMNQQASFSVCPEPPPLKACTIHVSRIGHKAEISKNGVEWAALLDGRVGVMGCAFAVQMAETFKVMPVASSPYGAGLFTKDTEITVLTEDDEF